MHQLQCRTDDAIADTRQPPGTALALLVHVQAQHFDEEHFREFGENAFAAGPWRARLSECVSNRGFEPQPSVRAAHVDSQQRRQAGEQQLREPLVAREVAADQLRHRATAAVRELARSPREHGIELGAGRSRQAWLGGHAMRIALRK